MPASPRSKPVTRAWLKRGVVVAVAIAVAAGAWTWWGGRAAKSEDSAYRTATAERGDIRVVISATGTLAAISTVDVGTQISGQVIDVLADFNDRVTRGQVLARIDPSTFQAQISQGNAAVESARAQLAAAQATLANAEVDYTRKAALSVQKLVARSDADLARANRDQARAQVNVAAAQIRQQSASTLTSRLNLDRAVIRSPVDGVVLTRTVEPGQTVAASLQAPVLFQIAEDLSQMEIVLAIDEADIGQVKVGQGADFTVDAFPDRRFRGRVQQVRLSATNTSNVITYPVVLAVDNPGQVLLPGMTANAEIEVSSRNDVLRVPNAALRFKPAEGSMPEAAPDAPRGGIAQDLPRIADTLKLDDTQRASFDAAVQSMQQRMASRRAAPAGGAGGSTLFGRGPGGPGGGGQRGGGGDASGAMRQRMAERFNQQFAEFRTTLNAAQQAAWDAQIADVLSARRAPVYVLVDGAPQMRQVRIGASDGNWTEVSGLEPGATVIVGGGRATPTP